MRNWDGRKAVDSATTACELTEWKSSVNIDVLAAAYGEVGEFEKAVEYEEKGAKALARSECQKRA